MGDRPELTTTVVVTLTAVNSHSHSHSSRESQSTAVSKVSEIRPLEYSEVQGGTLWGRDGLAACASSAR